MVNKPPPGYPHPRLTRLQVEVLRSVMAGETARGIGNRLQVSLGTVHLAVQVLRLKYRARTVDQLREVIDEVGMPPAPEDAR